MTELGYPEWQKPYRVGLLEGKTAEKLAQLVDEAERAMLSGLQEIRIGPDSRMEVRAIEDALSNLRVLKNET